MNLILTCGTIIICVNLGFAFEAQGTMNSILITGCDKGIGLGIVKQLLKLNQPVRHIFATCRHPEKATVT